MGNCKQRQKARFKLNSDYNASDINQILRKLYETNFFKNLTIKIVDNKILIDVEENKIIQTLLIEGVKSNKVKEAIKEIIYSNLYTLYYISDLY